MRSYNIHLFHMSFTLKGQVVSFWWWGNCLLFLRNWFTCYWFSIPLIYWNIRYDGKNALSWCNFHLYHPSFLCHFTGFHLDNEFELSTPRRWRNPIKSIVSTHQHFHLSIIMASISHSRSTVWYRPSEETYQKYARWDCLKLVPACCSR